ncbi:MAG: anti-sigma factor, partial [Acidimicrobiia bacterium]|nr:anti-sigma factor [Acidimicrobiia bacterium]
LSTSKPTADVEAVLAATMQQPSSTFVNLDGSGATEVLVVLSSDGTGYVARHNLPALTDGRTYQLWAVIDDRVISAGVLGPDPGVVPFRVDTPDLQGFAITAETSGGVAVSSEQPVAAWLKDA